MNRRISRFILAVIAGFGLLLAALVIYRLTGHPLGIRDKLSQVKSTILVQLARDRVAASAQGKQGSVIFLHHSVGNNLIAQGDVRGLFTQAGYAFWDHDYNGYGVTDAGGVPTGYSYSVPNDNTDIDGLARIFSQKEYPLPINTLSALLQYDVIIVKSCFPNNDITSEEQFARHQAAYRTIRDTIDRHPDKLFILMTSPPLNPAETNPEIAARARRMAEWLASEEFLGGRENFFVYNFYERLAENDPASADYNQLKQAYRDGGDSHPNQAANQEIAPEFVAFVVAAAEGFR